jgi:hypothetical protein
MTYTKTPTYFTVNGEKPLTDKQRAELLQHVVSNFSEYNKIDLIVAHDGTIPSQEAANLIKGTLQGTSIAYNSPQEVIDSHKPHVFIGDKKNLETLLVGQQHIDLNYQNEPAELK